MVDDIEIGNLKSRVSMLERQVQFLLRQLNMQYTDPPANQLYPDVVEMKRRGNVIEAIKLYREHTGVGLAEAKSFVDKIQY